MSISNLLMTFSSRKMNSKKSIWFGGEIYTTEGVNEVTYLGSPETSFVILLKKY